MAKRINKAVPKWDGDRWIYRPVIAGRQRAFYSTLQGKQGATECKRKADLERAGQTSDGRIADLWVKYLEEVAIINGLESEPYVQAEKFGRLHILPKCKSKKVSAMTSQDWQTIINTAKPVEVKYKTKSVIRTRTQSGQLSAKTLMHIRSQIMLFCKFCRKSGALDRMPEDLVIPKSAEKVGKAFLEIEELVRFINFDDQEACPYLQAWKLQMYLGLRPGEVLGIQLSDIKDDRISISRSINDNGQITAGKNRNAKRHEALFDMAQTAISAQIEYRAKHKVLSPWLFLDSGYSMPSQKRSYRQFKKFVKDNNFSHEVSPYSLRHTFTSVMNGRLKEEFLKAILGHSRSMDTLGIYAHQTSDLVLRSGAAVQEAWDSVLKVGK